MPNDSTIEDAIKENAAGPKRASSDSVTVEQHSLTEQIEADRYVRSKNAMSPGNLGFKRTKCIPPGSA